LIEDTLAKRLTGATGIMNAALTKARRKPWRQELSESSRHPFFSAAKIKFPSPMRGSSSEIAISAEPMHQAS
jgi:hypothetical protein